MKFTEQLEHLSAGHLISVEEIEGSLQEEDPSFLTKEVCSYLDYHCYIVSNLSQIVIGTNDARRSIQEIVARHDDILMLQKSILELHELFVDMSILIEYQGEMIDSIENHVSRTRSFMDRGTKALDKARKFKEKDHTVC